MDVPSAGVCELVGSGGGSVVRTGNAGLPCTSRGLPLGPRLSHFNDVHLVLWNDDDLLGCLCQFRVLTVIVYGLCPAIYVKPSLL